MIHHILTNPQTFIIDGAHGSHIEDGRSYRHSFGYAPRRPRPVAERDRESRGSRRSHGEDEATLRQMLLEYVQTIS